MNQAAPPLTEMTGASRRVARRVLDIGANRLELLVVEVQEAREHLLHAFLFALGVAGFGLLAGIALSAGVVLLFWNHSPVAVLGGLTVFHAGASYYLYTRLSRLRCEWEAFSETLAQLRKDCECLADTLR